MNTLKFLALSLFSIATLSAQPPPPCYANNNTGAGGVIGNGHYLSSYSDSTINFSFKLGTDNEGVEFNDILVLYLATGVNGRSLIDGSVDDFADPYRIAISNSNINNLGSTISFPEGFEVTHAIAIDTNSGGLYAIQSSGTIGSGGLNFIGSVNSTLTSNTQIHFQISFDASDIGLLPHQPFMLLGTYISHTGFTYDEGYGAGITPNTQGTDNIVFDDFSAGSGCWNSLGINDINNVSISAYYLDDHLIINGLNETVKISVYDLLGRKISVKNYTINSEISIPMLLKKNTFQFIVIETANKKKVIKVISN